MVFKGVCPISGLHISGVVIGRSESNEVTVEGTFAQKYPSYNMVEPSIYQKDIDCLSLVLHDFSLGVQMRVFT